MSKKVCGMLPPRQEEGPHDSTTVSVYSPCIRKAGHSDGVHIYRDADGYYVSFEENWDIENEKYCEDGHVIILFSLPDDHAKELLASEKPLQ